MQPVVYVFHTLQFRHPAVDRPVFCFLVLIPLPFHFWNFEAFKVVISCLNILELFQWRQDDTQQRNREGFEQCGCDEHGQLLQSNEYLNIRNNIQFLLWFVFESIWQKNGDPKIEFLDIYDRNFANWDSNGVVWSVYSKIIFDLIYRFKFLQWTKVLERIWG